MKISGWGNYPQIESDQLFATTLHEASAVFASQAPQQTLARGLGRSYGDSSLYPRTINLTKYNYFINFDEVAGLLTCTSGVSLADILNIFAPKGWFLPVTPGTKFITVGGAIASDVHGKNHHKDGCFSQHIIGFTILTANGDIVECSPTTHIELFRATCGGMGLTGIILTAILKLTRIRSAFVAETIYKTKHLKETIELLDITNNSTYSAAWIDCLTQGKHMGRSLLMLGEHAGTGSLIHEAPTKHTIPCNVPNFMLNSLSISLFNTLYYHRITQRKIVRSCFYDPFFYPLDGINHWNRLYGKNGFVQYQFVLPQQAGLEGMTAILKKISASKKGSFLAVLKATGEVNDNYLSFPLAGYSLALDFKVDSSIFNLLNELDNMVIDYGGRVYLTKDARMNEQTFKKSYPQWEIFTAFRAQSGADKVFNSLQSIRLGI